MKKISAAMFIAVIMASSVFATEASAQICTKFICM
jgi:hypothetical protein